MIAEFQKHWDEEYKIKTTEELQSVIEKRNTRNEKNTKTQHDRNTTSDMDETRTDGDEDALVHQTSALSDLLGDSATMDVDVDSVETELNALKTVYQVSLDQLERDQQE